MTSHYRCITPNPLTKIQCIVFEMKTKGFDINDVVYVVPLPKKAQTFLLYYSRRKSPDGCCRNRQNQRPLLSFVCTIFYLNAFSYPDPEVFLESFLRVRERATARREWKTSGYLDLQPHFHADDSCQTRQSDQWQHSKHMLISRYFFFY